MPQSNPFHREGSWDTKGISRLPKVTTDNGKFEPKQSNLKTLLSHQALPGLSEPLLANNTSNITSNSTSNTLIILLKEENQTVCPDIKFSFKKLYISIYIKIPI